MDNVYPSINERKLKMNKSFVESLIAINGHPEYNEKLKPYQNFIGSWEFEWVGHNEDGTTWTVPGEWHFSWILGGRAIQDIWICPENELRTSGQYPEGEYGTVIRFYDFKEDCIKIIWIGPILSNLNIFKVTISGDKIIQDEIMAVNRTKISRWEFKDIRENSFKWESYISIDNTKTWKMDQEVFAARKV